MEKLSRWFKKSMRWSICLLLVMVLGVGLTVAYLTDIEAAVNKLTVGKISVDVTEDPQALTKTDIGITAKGTSKCYVRMRVTVPTLTYPIEGQEDPGQAIITLADETTKKKASEWESYTGQTQAKIVDASDPQTFVAATWKKIGDFWYLSIPLETDDVAYLIKEITYPGLWDNTNGQVVTPLPDGITEAMLTISITAEAVQADGIDVGDKKDEEAALEAFHQVDPASTNG